MYASAFIVAAAAGLAAAAATGRTSSSPLALRQDHADCAYAPTTGGVVYQGTCSMAGDVAGVCNLSGFQPAGCDYPYHNDGANSACDGASGSVFRCQKDGDPCWAYKSVDNVNFVMHCSKQSW